MSSSNCVKVLETLQYWLQDSPYLEPGIEGIVDQVIGPKILPAIEPQMENIMYKMFGIEKPESGDEDSQQNDNGNNGGIWVKIFLRLIKNCHFCLHYFDRLQFHKKN